jgi:hypothetical protein
MLENYTQEQLKGIYTIVATEYGLTVPFPQCLQDVQIVEVLESILSDQTIVPSLQKQDREDRKTIVTSPSDKLAKSIASRTVASKGRKNTRINKNKTQNISVSDNVIALAKQDHIRSDNYTYCYDRRLSIVITPQGYLSIIDKKLNLKITIGKFISYHPNYTFVVSNQDLSLNVLLTIQSFIADLRNVIGNDSKKLEDCRYWLTFRDKTNPLTVSLAQSKADQDFAVWYAKQTFSTLKNWIRKQANKGINTSNWYIKLDTQKLIDDGRIKQIWLTSNGYDSFNLTPKLR